MLLPIFSRNASPDSTLTGTTVSASDSWNAAVTTISTI